MQPISNLAVGAKVKFGRYSVNGEAPESMVWRIVAKNHHLNDPGYPENAVTLHTDGIIDLRCYDATESGYTNGNPRYSISNIDQWLNKDSAAGEWYESQHTGDSPPDTSSRCGGYNTQYKHRPGFLHYFTETEKSAVCETDISCHYSGSYESITRKVFLPSAVEMRSGIGLKDGSVFANGTKDDAKRSFTKQCRENSPSTSFAAQIYFTRTEKSGSVYHISADGSTYTSNANIGRYGIAPVLNLPNDIYVSDETDDDKCYCVVGMYPPTVPSYLSVSSAYGHLLSGREVQVYWGNSTGEEGESITYEIEASYNEGTFSVVAEVSNKTSATVLLPEDTDTALFRIRSVGCYDAKSDYRVSEVYTVIKKNTPVISGSDADLGIVTEAFYIPYTVTDADGDSVEVTESLNEVILKEWRL